MPEKIEILGLDIFETHKEEMSTVERLREHFHQGIGWHYYLDLAWMVREIRRLPSGSLVLDAGAGGGMAQFILSELGYNVISADFASRVLSRQRMKRYAPVIHYLNDQSEVFDNRYTQHLKRTYNIPMASPVGTAKKVLRLFRRGTGNPNRPEQDARSLVEENRHRPKDRSPGEIPRRDVRRNCGRIFLYKCDLKEMPLLPDGFVDGVVSISALEHNDHEDLERCVDEILRVTRPGGMLAVTVSASQSGDWFHEPSKGWCYEEASLRRLFRLGDDVPSNYFDKERLFEMLRREDNELHRRLASFYFKSGDNGMPWGKWDPRYQPVGVIKVKRNPVDSQ